MADCPSCGRYVGPYDACPQCGARLTGRLRIRAVKIGAILCATIGLAALWLLAVRAEIPIVRVGEIDAQMNLAYVRLAGRCVAAPSYDAQSGYLSFWIDDGTGEIRVASYRSETERMIDLGRVPALGDMVEVAGTLRVRDDVPALVVNVPEQLEITRSDPADSDIRAIGPEDQYQRVRVRGQIRDARSPYPGLTLFILHDGTGSIPVVLSDELIALTGAPPPLAVGRAVEVVGAVSLYRDEPQLVPATTDGIALLPGAPPFASERPIGQLSPFDSGSLVLVRGTVAESDTFSAGTRLTLDDGTGRVTVLVWQSLFTALPAAAVESGARIEVIGEVEVYRDELEIVPLLAADVKVLGQVDEPPEPPEHASAASTPPPADSGTLESQAAPATSVPIGTQASGPTIEPAPQVTAIGRVTADRAGEELTVQGDVVAAASFSHGFRFTLDDGTGQIVLLMWHEVYDACWDAAVLNVGASLRATGEVTLYDTEVQIQPAFGGDVTAVIGAEPRAPPRDIGTLSGDDVGQRVMIEGHVIRVEGLSTGVKVFLGDETGEVVVLIWRNVLDRIASNTGLGTPGSRVRLVGTVGIYRSNLEVIPALPVDVAVLTIPQG